ncbi:hypothetical protein [Streptomyces sp. NPDC048272]|uniref:hypothetical protein n=1 Tax=Streptomyces sp. NPDC048272 TaxID=3154616 RepID=UPI0034457251
MTRSTARWRRLPAALAVVGAGRLAAAAGPAAAADNGQWSVLAAAMPGVRAVVTHADHPGAVVALEDRPAGAGAGIDVRQAVAARLHLRVTGPTAPALAVRDVRVGGSGGRAQVRYSLHNLGNVTLRPRAVLTVSGAFGRTLSQRTLTGLPTALLPGREVRLAAGGTARPRWSGPG